MLQNWLKPLPPALLKEADALPSNTVGKHLALHRPANLPDLRGTKIALLGLDEKAAREVRRHFYRMAWPFEENTVADLGDVRRAETASLVPLIFELLSGKILPVLIGGRDELAVAQFLGYQETKSLVNMVAVDERLRISASSDSPEEIYNHIFLPKRHPMLFHFGLVGLQSHQVPTAVLEFLEKNNFDALRLGKARSAMEEAEPVIRDADLVAFHLSALRQGEAPGVSEATPSGFFSEEACQLCRYAGMSDKLTSLGIYGFQPSTDREGQTAQVVAQMLWYFTEGFFNRKRDFPASSEGLTEYIVDLPELRHQITFWKSERSGRWWMQVPVGTKRKHQRHRLVPCSYQDYQSAAMREELPERLLQAFSRFG